MITRLSQFFLPILPPEHLPRSVLDSGVPKSYRLLLQAGYIHNSSNGIFSLLPIGQLVLERLMCVIDQELLKIGCCKLSLPILQSNVIWKKSGRFRELEESKDIYTTYDDLVLAPTAEEEICKLVTETTFTHKCLPLKLYQIGSKFRREPRPRGGLLRAKEFLMKDLYTFDKDLKQAKATYNLVIDCYEQIFKALELPIVTCKASNGAMGGLESREFHLQSDIGEDVLQHCISCEALANKELALKCCEYPKIEAVSGLELGHAFLLGELYAVKLGGLFTDSDQSRKPFQMGCYGLGISRLISAMAEVHSDCDGLAWPYGIAPFRSSIIYSDTGLDISTVQQIEAIRGATLVDDRPNMSIGKKLKDHYLIGVPTIIVIGNRWKESSQLEIHDRKKRTVIYKTIDELAGAHI